MKEVTLSSKNQIVIPREAREALGAKAGDKLLCVPRGNLLIILPRPNNYSRALRGIAKNRFNDRYLKDERAAWD